MAETSFDERQPAGINYAYQLLMLVLCVYAVAALAGSLLLPLTAEVRQLLEYVDFGVCVLFLGDFVYNLVTARNRLRYFLIWGWIDLLSSIPMLDAFRVGRLARVLRVIRVLRGLKATRLLVSTVLGRRRQTAVMAVVLVSFSLIVFASLAVLAFEPGQGGGINTAGDALWWAITTITTVGYGDIAPVTFEGRIVASVLMVAGVGLFGMLSGLIASWLLGGEAEAARGEIDELKATVAELRQLVAEFKRSEPGATTAQ